jgi:16S rRNA (cytidine1402-2'-O)-methyltransferase
MQPGKVFLIPTFLHEDARQVLPAYILDAVKECQAFFVETEKTARRYLKSIWREMVIDDYQWFTIHKAEVEVVRAFTDLLRAGKNVGIISEAGCPGVADPGQLLVQAAQAANITVVPLVGPNSILLALMASGMNGQCFQFHGYLPIESTERKKKLKELEAQSRQQQCTQIFIETPYRNNQLIGDIMQSCRDETRICIAVDITAPSENIRTRTVKQWKQEVPDIHKRLAIFLMQAV